MRSINLQTSATTFDDPNLPENHLFTENLLGAFGSGWKSIGVFQSGHGEHKNTLNIDNICLRAFARVRKSTKTILLLFPGTNISYVVSLQTAQSLYVNQTC